MKMNEPNLGQPDAAGDAAFAGSGLVHLGSEPDEPPVPPPANVYWTEQSEDTLLRNLFSNASLGYEFGAKEADFDCLGLDNLQLDYPVIGQTATDSAAGAGEQQPSFFAGPDATVVAGGGEDSLAASIANDLTNLNMNISRHLSSNGPAANDPAAELVAVLSSLEPAVGDFTTLLDANDKAGGRGGGGTLPLVTLNDPSLAAPVVVNLVPVEDPVTTAPVPKPPVEADSDSFIFKKPLDSAIPSLQPAKKLQKTGKSRPRAGKGGGKAARTTSSLEQDEESEEEAEEAGDENDEEDNEQVDSDDEAEEESDEDEDDDDEPDNDDDDDDEGFEHLDDIIASIAYYHDRRSSFEKYRRIENALESFDLISHLKSAQSRKEKDKSLLKLRQLHHSHKQLSSARDRPKSQSTAAAKSHSNLDKAKTQSQTTTPLSNMNSSGFFSNTSNSSLSTSPINQLFTFKRSKKRSKAFLSSLIDGPKVKIKTSQAMRPASSEEDAQKRPEKGKELTTIVELISKTESRSPVRFHALNQQATPSQVDATSSGGGGLIPGRKMTKKEKLKQIKLINSLNEFHQSHIGHHANNSHHNSNFEPKTKKIAIDSHFSSAKTSTSGASTRASTDQQVFSFLKTPPPPLALPRVDATKKEDDDLHINELSLLDLHSSEDDTSHGPRPATDFLLINRNLKTKLGSINGLKKNMRPLSRESLPSAESKEPCEPAKDSSTRKQGHLNEIISKRVKYSPASSARVVDKPNAEPASEDYVLVPESAAGQRKSGQIDALIQGLNNSSLESGLTNTTTTKTGADEDKSTDTTSSKKQNKRKKKDSLATPPPRQTSNKLAAGRFRSGSLKKKPVSKEHEETTEAAASPAGLSTTLDFDTLQHMKNLDLNTDKAKSSAAVSISSRRQQFKPKQAASNANATGSVVSVNNLTMNLNDESCRKHLWNLLKAHSSADEMVEQFGSLLHDRLTFWDLVEMKLKHSQRSKLKTAYDIIDDYTVLYTNMSELLESFIDEGKLGGSSSNGGSGGKKEGSSRSRSSSRTTYRKHSLTSSLNRS